MIARSLKSWLAKGKVSKSKNKEEGESQNVTAAAVVKKKDGEQETIRRRGAQCASEFATVATLRLRQALKKGVAMQLYQQRLKGMVEECSTMR